MVQYINTIKDLEAATYGIHPVGGNQLFKSAGGVMGIIPGHDQTLSIGTGAAGAGLSALYNKIYGQKVWSMLNQEINPLAILPKRPYTQSGWRVMTTRPIGGANAQFGIGGPGGGDGYASAGTKSANLTTGSSAGTDSMAPDLIGGVDENHSLASLGLEAVAPEYTTLFMSPKTVAHMFDYSELAAEMAKLDDGVGDLRAIIREDMGKLHAETQSMMLIMPLDRYDMAATGALGTQYYTSMERNYTSLMKVIASSAEIEEMATQNMIASAAGTGKNAEVVDVYGDTSQRDAATAVGSSAGFMDCEVNLGDGYASTEQRVLTLTILNTLIQNLRTNGGTPKVILTGYDTIQALSDLLQAQERFIDGKEVIPTHNGVRGVKGQEVGFRVATYYDIPLIPCKDMRFTTNTAITTGLSDMLWLDTDHLWFSTLKPTQYFEDGINHGNPFGIGTLGNRGLFRTMGEVGCSFFRGQGKITNIK